jgi:hypothetical protein
MSGCAKTKTQQLTTPIKQNVSAVTTPVTQSSAAGPKIYFQRKYDLELSMGGDCPKTVQSSMRWVDPCIGKLPNYFQGFLSGLAAKRRTLLHKEAYQQVFESSSSEGEFYFRAAPGFGQRPDILVSLPKGAWIRSFEGFDPAITMYLVNGPFVCTGKEWNEARKANRAWECERSVPRFRLFRMTAHGIPQDVTLAKLPKPVLSVEERKRYFGRGHADLNLENLPNVPVMQWHLLLDADAPLPKSDPRWTIGGGAHFGFVVWDGKSFELHQRVYSKLWPCYQSPFKAEACKSYKETDRFIIDAE